MARYFFQMIDGVFLPDTKGEELATIADAQRAAIARASAAVMERGAAFWKSGDLRIVVTDEAGDSQFELALAGRTYPKPTAVAR